MLQDPTWSRNGLSYVSYRTIDPYIRITQVRLLLLLQAALRRNMAPMKCGLSPSLTLYHLEDEWVDTSVKRERTQVVFCPAR